MSAVKNVLVVGGGIAGMCAAIELRQRGIEVEVLEADPEWRVHGAGITISALRTAGVSAALGRRVAFKCNSTVPLR